VRAVLRVVGPPGSGKTLLVTSLVEALRSRGYRVASAARRQGPVAGEVSTVVVLSSGGRVTLERALPLAKLIDVVASIDPSLDLLLAEGADDAGYPVVEIVGEGRSRATASPDLLATVPSAKVLAAFGRLGPGETLGLADIVEQRLLGAPMPVPDRGKLATVLGRGALPAIRRLWSGRGHD
jgi:molybdopterin-guanine dinucleotide biosynthesis protein